MTGKDMKTCIKDFLKHVETLEGEEDPEGCGFHREYRVIHELQIKNRRENVFKSDAGREEKNLKKNRYKDILPYDDHRVTIKTKDEEETDYINASNIKGVKGSNGYIATQGPLAVTTDDFWQMIWEQEVEIVFMACRIVEMGKIKCKQYWNDVGCSDDFGDINVLTNSEENISSDFIKRVFLVRRGDTERTIIQYHYSGWPDHGIPDDPAHIKDLIGLVRQSRTKWNIPELVHCSAGCGRTGAIIAIDYVWTLLEEGKLDEKFSVYDMICKFREQRMSMVQTPDQYALVYRVLKSLCEDWLIKMASHTYVNVEVEDEYVNIDSVAKDQEEHIYEDSNCLSEMMKDVNLISTANQSASQTSSPASPPAQTKPTNISNNKDYVNVELSTKKSDVPFSNDKSKEDQVLHRTVIQIGAVDKSSANNNDGKSNSKEVVNWVRSDSTRRGLSQTFSTPLPQTTDTDKVKAEGKGDRRKVTSLHETTTRSKEVPDRPPSFDERLPRVRGPIPMPSHWNQS